MTNVAISAMRAARIRRRTPNSDHEPKGRYRFVIVPKVVHPWFELVHEGAKDAAEYLKQIAGIDVTVEYRAPQQASVVEQNQILASVIATQPDGIAIDLLDSDANRPVLQEVMDRDIQLAAFDSVPPEGMIFTSIGNDFCQQAKIASERLVKILGGRGKVAIMHGVPTAPNHRIRYECHKEVFEKFRDIEIVAEGIDNDNIEQAQQQATAIMKAHRDLDGWVACDAAGPIGIGRAIMRWMMPSKSMLTFSAGFSASFSFDFSASGFSASFLASGFWSFFSAFSGSLPFSSSLSGASGEGKSLRRTAA